MTTNKPLFIHLIGLEGCGHHGVFPIFKQVLSDKYAGMDKQLCFRTGLRGFFHAAYYKGLPKNLVFEDLHKFLYHNPEAIFVDDNSYPSSTYREPRQQWDFAEIHAQLRDKCDVRFVRVRRNVFNTVNSHRDWDGGLMGHAQILARIQGFIDEKFVALEGQGIPLFDLDYDNIESSASVIAEIADCEEASVTAAIEAVFTPSAKDYADQLSDGEIKEIGDLFGVTA